MDCYAVLKKYFKDIMRQERNQLLKDCEHCALPEFPNRDQWLVYRQLLRDLPEDWTINTPFPQPSTEYKRYSFFILGLYIWHCLDNF
jgi:hypothetical protein